jgi:hypothetical protein
MFPLTTISERSQKPTESTVSKKEKAALSVAMFVFRYSTIFSLLHGHLYFNGVSVHIYFQRPNKIQLHSQFYILNYFQAPASANIFLMQFSKYQQKITIQMKNTDSQMSEHCSKFRILYIILTGTVLIT